MIEREHIKFAVLAADIAVFTVRDGTLLVRLMKVERPPFFSDTKGLPGGLLDSKETAEQAARRIVEERASIDSTKLYMEQLYTFSGVDRDPRGRVVAVGYLALVAWEKLSEAERVNTKHTWWHPASRTRKLAYDHDTMLSLAIKRLHSRITYTTVISKLMPKEFTLTELETAYKSILGTDLDKRNFRKKVLKLKIVVPTTGKRTGGRFRPAQLYHFVSNDIVEIKIL